MYSWRLIVARYGFWDADQDDDAAFDRRLGAVLREVGDRGKLVLSEAVPPSFREPAPAPAPAPAPTPAPAPAPAPARVLAERQPAFPPPNLPCAEVAPPAPAASPAGLSAAAPSSPSLSFPTVASPPRCASHCQLAYANSLFGQFIYKNAHFAKTGSGQTWEKLRKKGSVFRTSSSHRQLVYARAPYGKKKLFQLFLCLSRAGLGKCSVLSVKRRKKAFSAPREPSPAPSRRCEKNGSFSELSLRLSRACLGEMVVLIHKCAERPFSHLPQGRETNAGRQSRGPTRPPAPLPLAAVQQHWQQPPEAAAAARALLQKTPFPINFLMSVQSLYWQSDQF